MSNDDNDNMSNTPQFQNLTVSSVSTNPPVYMIRMNKPPENRLTTAFAQEIISALRVIERRFRPHVTNGTASTSTGNSNGTSASTNGGNGKGGAVIISSFSSKFWCTGLDLDESDHNPYANSDGFYPLLATLLDYPYPTIALITGHTFGGACPFALACDYRVMNSRRGFFSMPPVDLGLHFDGIGTLPRLKLKAQVARRMLLEAYRWTGEQALEDGIVDVLAEPDAMESVAVEKAKKLAPRAKMGVYGLLRAELYGEALEKLKGISYVHRKRVGTSPKVKI